MAKETSLKDYIYNEILQGIIEYEYKPNQIINEKELMGKYECSKSPVREALVSLCNDNILRNIPRYGYEVIRLTREDIEDMLQFRYLLEGGMLKTTVDQWSEAQIEKLVLLDSACTAVAEDVWKHWEYNTNFHLQMMAFSRNECAYCELKRILNRLKLAYAQFHWNRWDVTSLPTDTRNHKQIIGCIKTKDKDSLLAALREDLMDFGEMRCAIHHFF